VPGVALLAKVLQAAYLVVGLASLCAVTVILERQKRPRAVVAAPVLSALAVIAGFQAYNFVLLGLPPFAFGLYSALIPALALVPPIAIVLIAFSRRTPP